MKIVSYIQFLAKRPARNFEVKKRPSMTVTITSLMNTIKLYFLA